MNLVKILFSVIIIFASTHIVLGQSSAELKKQREKIEVEIASLNKELAAKTREKMLSQKEVNALSRQLNLREDKISIINKELNNLSAQINSNTKTVNTLKEDLQKMKDDYEKMVMFAFRNKNSYNKMMFIFASKDFNQAFKRVKYLQQFTDARKIKVAEMESVKREIELKITQLEVDRKTQKDLLSDQQEERNIIAKDRAEHQGQLNQIVKEERSVKGELSKKQQQKKKIDTQIKAAIAREIAEERRKAEEERKRKAEAEAKRTGKTVAEVEKTIPKKTDSEILRSTPEAARLSADFQSNKGRLPWPVTQGHIVRSYGRTSVEGVVIDQPDIAIRTADNAAVKSVFEGQVVQALGGIVVIKHGEYFSFYSNLASVLVRTGQKVTRGQQIGTADKDSDLGYSVVNFGLQKGMSDFEPSSWLAR